MPEKLMRRLVGKQTPTTQASQQIPSQGGDIASDAVLQRNKRHRGERWGTEWREGAAPTKEDAEAAFCPSRKGTARKRAKDESSNLPRRADLPAFRRRDATVPPETSPVSLRASETAAQKAVQSRDFSLESVLEVLRLIEVPPNFTRKNVMPAGQEYVQGLMLGLYVYGGSVGLSAKTSKHPWLTKLLIGALRAVAADFPFTSIQLNYNYASRPHVDKNNLGTSFIVGLGDYTGGELWVHDESGDSKWTMRGEQDVTAFYHVGRELNGQSLQIRNAWTIFDGNKLHWTNEFEGERYSVIYFTSDRYETAPEDVRNRMYEAGFDFDFSAADLKDTLKDKHQQREEIAKQVAVERAREEKQKLLMRGRCIGRVWASAWGLRCTAVCEEGSEFCGSHMQRDRWKTHGRMDGDLPPAKRDEMAYYQQILVKSGKKPPVREGATILVPIPGWPETDYLGEVMKHYGKFCRKPKRKQTASTQQ
eukprot:TRINITY_DN34561_c0_g1_i1.p1 TRINITY_DN34561_c0_g1~~TRINITY_DN34561_c0_g1_i1.p1  ORF type:complete len:477 (+),score=62.96 TRINITY_DN34561_c0_g1_i1:190-1620(+)